MVQSHLGPGGEGMPRIAQLVERLTVVGSSYTYIKQSLVRFRFLGFFIIIELKYFSIITHFWIYALEGVIDVSLWDIKDAGGYGSRVCNNPAPWAGGCREHKRTQEANMKHKA